MKDVWETQNYKENKRLLRNSKSKKYWANMNAKVSSNGYNYD